LVGIAPAIGNAIYDAVGVRITGLPVTPEKLLAALKAKSAWKD
jgi:CO/xanthine dehydrogenase Mo-binding subunit